MSDSGRPRLTDRRARLGLLRGLQLLGAGLILVGVVAISAQAQAETSFPLDKYPGFGRSAQAALRDDTIAYWEAFRREQFIASCMSEAEFMYSPVVAYPTEAMLAVAQGLGVQAGSAPGSPPVDRNRAYEGALSSEERERFNQALFGESAADVAESDRTGRVPDGSGADFRSGGCFGDAEGSAPSVWDVRRELDDELVAMQRSLVDSPELDATRAAYRECAQRVGSIAADGPADVDAFAARGGSEAAAAASVLEECDRVWMVGYRQAGLAVAERFVQQHAAALTAIEDRYRNVMQTIRDDHEFLAYLSEQVALAGSGGDGQGDLD